MAGRVPAIFRLRMGISRQAIYRSAGEVQMLGYLTREADPDRRNQKTVVMTDAGEALVGEARAAPADIEETLASRIRPEAVRTLRDALEREWGSP